MQKMRHRIWLLMGVTMIMLTFPFAGCTGGGGITSEEAITIATEAVENDGVMSLDGRVTEIEDELTYWHVYFPFSSPITRGGSPHVFVNKTSGAVIDLYYTE